MGSHKLFRGYMYAGFCLAISLLVIINSAEFQSKVTKEYDDHINQSPRTIGFSKMKRVSVTCTVFLVRSVISTVFTLGLLFGMIMRRVNFVTYYIWYLTTFHVIEMIGLFIGCIICGCWAGELFMNPWKIEDSSGLVIAVTIGFCSLIVLGTLFYCLSLWILNGVINHIKHDISRLDSV